MLPLNQGGPNLISNMGKVSFFSTDLFLNVLPSLECNKKFVDNWMSVVQNWTLRISYRCFSECGPSVYSENCSFHHHMFFRFGWTSFSDSTLVWAYLCPCSHCQKDIHFLTARVTADDVCYICWWWIAVPISANFWDSIRLKERYFIKLWQVSMYVCVRVYIHLQMHVCIYVYIWILYVYMIKIVLFKRERTEADKCRMYVALSMRNP